MFLFNKGDHMIIKATLSINNNVIFVTFRSSIKDVILPSTDCQGIIVYAVVNFDNCVHSHFHNDLEPPHTVTSNIVYIRIYLIYKN